MNIKEEILSRTNKGLDVFCFYMPIDFVCQSAISEILCMTIGVHRAISISTTSPAATE